MTKKGSDPQEKERRQHQNKVHAAPKGHQSSGYKDPESMGEFKIIPKNTRGYDSPRSKIKIK